MALVANNATELLLSSLDKGAKVAVVRMLGSLCPITLGHVQCFEEARKILLADPSSEVARPSRLERFDLCLGLIALNGDGYVKSKLASKGQRALTLKQRADMVRLATVPSPWLNFADCENNIFLYSQRFPDLDFVEFDMNGADDVVKYEKWHYMSRAAANYRMLVMGRPGFTSALLQGMAEADIDRDDGQFIIGPELPDISSTSARDASKKEDVATLLSILHPAVADFLLRFDGHRGIFTQDEAKPSQIEGGYPGANCVDPFA